MPRCSSWSIYPRVHGDPGAIERPAGTGSQNGERIQVAMGHRMVYKSVQNECMELADGAAQLRDLALEAEQRRVSKHNLTKTSWSYGKNGVGAKYKQIGRMPEIPPGDHRAASTHDNTQQPRPYLWDYGRRVSSRTTMQDCMNGGLRPTAENVGKPAAAVDPLELKARLGTSSGVLEYFRHPYRTSAEPRQVRPRTRTATAAGTVPLRARPPFYFPRAMARTPHPKYEPLPWTVGHNKRDTRSRVGAHLVANRASAAKRGPVVAQETIAGTLFPSQSRSFETSAYETMRPDRYLDRANMRSREAGAAPKPTPNDGPIALDMPACFEIYRGGRRPVQ